MIVIKSTIGAGKRRHDVYDVCNSITDTGAERPDSIARFDTLELATVVMRYMRGDSLTDTDEYRAKEALKKAAAPTD